MNQIFYNSSDSDWRICRYPVVYILSLICLLVRISKKLGPRTALQNIDFDIIST